MKQTILALMMTAVCTLQATYDNYDYAEEPFCCETDSSWGTTVYASALYWKPYVDGMEYAVTDTLFQTFSSNGVRFEVPSNFELRDSNQLGNWGYRVGICQYICPLDWTLDAVWTHFQSHGSNANAFKELIAPPSGVTGAIAKEVNDIWSMFSLGDTPTALKTHIKTLYNVIDLSLNKDLCFDESFFAKIILGVRGALIDEDLKIQYISDNPTSSGALSFSRMQIRNDFKGVGPMIGFNPCINLGCGLAIEAQASASALYGRFKFNTDQNITFVIPDTFRSVSFAVLRDQGASRIQPNFNLGMSVNWNYSWSCFATFFSVGYEVDYWTNFIRQNRICNNLNAESSSSDLTGKVVAARRGDFVVHGLTLTAAVSF